MPREAPRYLHDVVEELIDVVANELAADDEHEQRRNERHAEQRDDQARPEARERDRAPLLDDQLDEPRVCIRPRGFFGNGDRLEVRNSTRHDRIRRKGFRGSGAPKDIEPLFGEIAIPVCVIASEHCLVKLASLGKFSGPFRISGCPVSTAAIGIRSSRRAQRRRQW